MLDAFLVPAKTVVTAKGDSEPLDISGAASRVFLLTLSISSIVEQEGMDVLVYTSADANTWDPKAIAGMEQKFYPGEYPLMVDLSQKPDAKFVGFDATPALVAAMQANEIQALVAQDPTRMGYLGVKTVVAQIKGEKVEPMVDTGVRLITPDSLKDPEIRKFLNME